MTTPLIPEADTLGQPTGPYTRTRTAWAVIVYCDLRGVPGPHHLGAQASKVEAQSRLQSWQQDRPWSNPRLVCRDVVETAGEWQDANR